MEDFDNTPGRTPAIEAEVTLKAIDMDALMELVADRVAARVLQSRAYDQDSLVSRVAALVEARVAGQLAELVQAKATDLLHAPIQRHDPFGQPVGTPTNVEAIVTQGAHAFLTELVDEKGVAPRDQWGRNKARPRIDWMLQDVVLKGFEPALKAEAVKLRQELEKRAREAVAQLLAGVKL